MTIAEIFETMDWGPAPESRSDAEAWLDRHDRRLGPFIAGRLREPAGETFPSINPADGSTLAEIAQCSDEELDEAVAAARQAQPAWAALGGHGRSRYLYAIARQVQKHSRLLAVLETLDNGKPIRETRDLDVPLVARHFYHHAGWAQLMESTLPGMEPIGVAGQIIPWNFPLLMLAWKIAPALAMGNTVVLKPAEFTSISALAFAEICHEVGLPAGVVNLVTGDGKVGEALVRHPGVDKIAFTGSTEVGRAIRRATAGSGKKLSLELGGKSPFIVFDDADLDSAIEGVVDAIWFNQGQVCCAGSRLLVHEGVAETFHAKLKARMERLRIGEPTDKAIDIGAIVAPVQLERIEELVARGVEEGAELFQPSWSCPTEGVFYPPTLFTGVEPASTIAQVEIFGPVLVSMTFRTPAEAVALANNTRYGLAASVWSESINLSLHVASQLQAGTVWINSTNLFDAAAGFGGYRESGYGREGGKEGHWEYVRPAWKAAADHRDDAAAPTEGTTGEIGGELTGARAAETSRASDASPPAIDRTAKMYIGGKQARPDSGYSRPVHGPAGELLGEVGDGNRKDLRNAVVAARKAQPGWGRATAHLRAQILYYVAENLLPRRGELAARLAAMTGAATSAAEREVEQTVDRLFTYAAWADKFEGTVHETPLRNRTITVNDPIGVVGVLCPEDSPLLGFVSTVFPALALGNAVVAVPSEKHPLAATDFYQILDTSDLPGGTLNIVTGARRTLAPVLADHDDVDALWSFGGAAEAAEVEARSIGNLKRIFADGALARDWADPTQGQGEEFLRQAVQVKNIWIPFGE